MTELRKNYIIGPSGNIANVNLVTNELEVAHRGLCEVYEGRYFTHTASDSDLDTDATLERLIITPDTTRWSHLFGSIVGASHTRLTIFEDCTHTSGVQQNVVNNNRNSVNVPGTIVTLSNNDNSDGNLIFTVEFGAATNKVIGGGQSRSDGSEWILKQNSTYLFRITSLADDNVVSLILAWYERIDNA